MYRYYFLLRPPAPGTHPRGATKVVSFDQKNLLLRLGEKLGDMWSTKDLYQIQTIGI